MREWSRSLAPRFIGGLLIVGGALGVALQAPPTSAQDGTWVLRYEFDGPDVRKGTLECVPRGKIDILLLRSLLPLEQLRAFDECIAETQQEQGVKSKIRQRVRRGNIVRNQWTFTSLLTQEQVEKLKTFAVSVFDGRPLASIPPETGPSSIVVITKNGQPDKIILNGGGPGSITLCKDDYPLAYWFEVLQIVNDQTDGNVSTLAEEVLVDTSGLVEDGELTYTGMTPHEVAEVYAFLNGPGGSYQDGRFVYPFVLGGTFDPATGRPLQLKLDGTITFGIEHNPPGGVGDVPIEILELRLSGPSRLGEVIISGGRQLAPTVKKAPRKGRIRRVEGESFSGTLQIGEQSVDFEFDKGFQMVLPWRRLRPFTAIRIKGVADVVGEVIGLPGDLDGPGDAGEGLTGRLRLRRARFGRDGHREFVATEEQ